MTPQERLDEIWKALQKVEQRLGERDSRLGNCGDFLAYCDVREALTHITALREEIG